MAIDSTKFYSNIDKLYKLINVSLQKDQIKNAEKYINYFFEVMVRYYEKSAVSSKTNQNISFPINISNNVKSKGSDEKINELLFPQRNIEMAYRDSFEDKIINLLSNNIKTDGFKVFYFVWGRLKDSIRILMKNKGTYKKAASLIRLIKFTVDQIYLQQNNLSLYERNWFLSESYNWFIELYAGNVKTADDIELFESEMLQILKYFVDNDQVDLFRKFLERLSSSIFSYRTNREHVISKYRPKEWRMTFKYENIIDNYREKTTGLISIYDFKETIQELSKSANLDLREFNLSAEEIEDFKTQFFELLLDEFKESYIKILLIKVIVYSFFKGKQDYFKQYLTYNQPDDSDAIWASKYYGIGSIQEIFKILPISESLILRDSLFFEGHHGFSVYLNTFLGYYLLRDEAQSVAVINSITDYNIASLTAHGLSQIQRANRFKIIADLLSLTTEEINQKLGIMIKAAEKKKEQIDNKRTTQADVSSEIVQNFKTLLIDHFYKCCSLRLLLEYYNLTHDIDDSLKDSDSNELGINQLLPKKAFIKENDTLFFNMHDSLAQTIADGENNSILFELERAAKKIKIKQNDLEMFLKENKKDYDIILSKGRYLVQSDFGNLNFTESWTMTSQLNNIPDFLGVLENNYNVFYLRIPSQEGYLLLNSKKLCSLVQLIPPDFKGAERFKIFNFSIIDFKNDQESLELHSKEISDSNLLEFVWVRIFEKFKLNLHSEFNGISIDIVG